MSFFQEKIVAPHLKHEYTTVCNVTLGEVEQKPVNNKLSLLFHWLFSVFSKGKDAEESQKGEL